MSGFIQRFQHSPFPSEDSSSHSESSIPSLDSLLKEAASSAQVYLYDDEDSLSQSSVEFETNYTEGSLENFIPLNLVQDSCSLKFNSLPNNHKEIFENLKSKVSYHVNFLSLENGTGMNEVTLVCKICCKILQISKVEEHVHDQEHLRNLVERCNSEISATEALGQENQKFMTSRMRKSSKGVDKHLHNENLKGTQRTFNNGKSRFVPASLAQADFNRKYKATTEFFHGNSDEVAQDLTSKLQDHMDHFELCESKWNKPCFSCKMCKISFPCKNARLHIYSNTHLRNLKKSLSVAKLEVSDAKNKTVVKRLVSQYNNRLYFFQLIHDNELNELYFICKVCTVVLISDNLKDHIYSSEHSKNLQENPVVLNYDSLNDHNKQIVRKLKDAIQIQRIKDFTFVYRVGTEELRFYCKCCQLVLIPEKVEDHVKTGEHFKAAKAESNSKRQASESDSTINKTAPSKTALSHMQIVPPPEVEHQNLTIVGFDSLNPTNKAIVKMLEDEFDSELIYFDLLRAVDTNELYFKCLLCDLTLKHTLVPEHVMSSDHMKSWELNVHFEDFLSLEEPSKKVLRKLFFEVGSKLNAFCLAPDNENRGLQFTCKFCHVSLCSDLVINHLHTKKHKKRTKEEFSDNYATTVSNDSFQQDDSKKYSDSELTTHQIVESMDPLSSGIHSSPPSSGLNEMTHDLNLESIKDCVEGVSKEHSCEVFKSGLNLSSGPKETRFICQDCSGTVCFKPAESNGLDRRIAEKFFVNCHGKSAEAILSDVKNCKVSNNTANHSASPATFVGRNIHGFESNGTHLPDNATVSSEKPREPGGVLSGSDKEILKMLIDKIGLKINNFDIMLSHSSNELCVKCKFCSEIMHPDSVENHVNHEAHLKYTQLSCASNLSFESLNDSNKKIVRKLFNQIGQEIYDFDVTVTLGFVCKICGANVNAETVSDHISSEEHLKCLPGHGRQGIIAERSRDCYRDHENIERMTQKTPSDPDTHFSALTGVNKNLHQLDSRSSVAACDAVTQPEFKDMLPKPDVSDHGKYFCGEDNTMGRTLSMEMFKKSFVTDLVSMTASQINSKDPNTAVSPKSFEKCTLNDKTQNNQSFSSSDKFTSVIANKRWSQDSRGPVGSSDLKSLTRVQNPPPSSPRDFSSRNEAVKCTASEEITAKVDAINFANSASSGKFQMDRKVSHRVLPLKPARKLYGDREIKEVLPIGSPGDIFAPSVINEKRSEVPEFPSDSNVSVFSPKTQKNNSGLAAADTLTFSYSKNSIQDPSVSRHEEHFSCELNEKPKQHDSRADVYLTCAACCLNLRKTHIEDIANHVNSEDHKIKLNLLPVLPQFSNLSNYNEKIVKMFLGDVSHKVNYFDILYEMPLKELCFYCRLCHITVRAEALEGHVNNAHLNNFMDFEQKAANHALSNAVDNAIDCSNFNFKEMHPKSRLFLCQVCDYKVYDEGVTHHFKSEKHLHLSNIRGDSLRFKSFSAYKEKVVAMLCCDSFIKASDFDFLLETGSPKLYLYCKPCKVLLWPESLFNHLRMTSSHSKGVAVTASQLKQGGDRGFESPENSSKCSLM